MSFFLATSCDLHPEETFTGFCPSCLRERLAGLDASSSLSSAPRRSTSALKSFFSILPSSSSTNTTGPDASSSIAVPVQPIASSSSELRRCKSFSARPASSTFVRSNSQIVREQRDPSPEIRPMKIHIDLESQSTNHTQNRFQKGTTSSSKDSPSSAGNFWIKKWNSWRNKQKQKKQEYSSKASKAAMPQPQKNPKPTRHTRPRRFCDTQSELGGRRSCDTDPRFSVDAGRISLDCPPRFSLDEPRASWDGHSISGRPVYSRMHPTLSTVEDAPDPVLHRSDGQMLVEEYDSRLPGSQSQTRDYYLDSSSRRRRSFERSISGRKLPQIDLETEQRSIANANSKVSPAGSTEFYHYHHAMRDDYHHAMRDELSQSFDSAYRDPCKISDNSTEKKTKKWSFWGLIHKKRNDKDQNANVVDRSFSEAWPELRPPSGGQFGRSNSTVSARNSFSGSMRRNSVDMNNNNNNNNNNNGKKRRDEFVLERNRSGRYSSPGRVDNGMLRFYLNPIAGNQSGRRSSGIRPVNYGNLNSQTLSSKRMF